MKESEEMGYTMKDSFEHFQEELFELILEVLDKYIFLDNLEEKIGEIFKEIKEDLVKKRMGWFEMHKNEEGVGTIDYQVYYRMNDDILIKLTRDLIKNYFKMISEYKKKYVFFAEERIDLYEGYNKLHKRLTGNPNGDLWEDIDKKRKERENRK